MWAVACWQFMRDILWTEKVLKVIYVQSNNIVQVHQGKYWSVLKYTEKDCEENLNKYKPLTHYECLFCYTFIKIPMTCKMQNKTN